MNTIKGLITVKEIIDALNLHNIVEEVVNEEHDWINTWLDLKAIEDGITSIKDSIKDEVISEVHKYPKDSVKINGKTVQIISTRKFDYKNDSTLSNWARLTKERQDLLKTIKEPIVNAETGEITNPAPFTTTITIKVSN